MDTPDWAKEALPELLHEVPFLADTENMEQFMGKLNNAAQHMGNSVRIPGPDANEEAWTEFDTKLTEKIPGLMRLDLDSKDQVRNILGKLGLPEEDTGYELDDSNKWLGAVAHKAGLTKDQLKTFMNNLNEAQDERKNILANENSEGLEALYKEWGFKKPEFISNILGLAKLTNAPEGLTRSIEEGTVDPTMLHWMSSLAKQFSQVKQFHEQSEGDDKVLTCEEARSQIEELLQSGKLFDQSKPQIIKDAQKKMLELQKMANPEADININALRADGQMFELAQ